MACGATRDPQAIFHLARYDPSTELSTDVALVSSTWNWAEDNGVFAFDAAAYHVWASGPVTAGIFEYSGAVTTYTSSYETGWLGFLVSMSPTTGFGYL